MDDTHLDFPCMSTSKNEFYGGTSNNTFDSLTRGLSNAFRIQLIDENVKSESPSQKAVA